MSILRKVLGISIAMVSAAFISRKLRSDKTTKAANVSDENNNNTKATDEEQEFETRTQKMYKDLSMTERQKERYEASISALKDDWTKNNPDKPFDTNSLLSEEDASLKAVLDEVQYGMYRDWAKKYAY